MESLGVFGILIILAFLVETLVEFIFGEIFDRFPALTPWKWTLKYIAVIVGVVGTFLYHFDILAISSKVIAALTPAGTDPPAVLAVTWYGMLITGIAIGKGSNYLHQFVSQFFPAKK